MTFFVHQKHLFEMGKCDLDFLFESTEKMSLIVIAFLDPNSMLSFLGMMDCSIFQGSVIGKSFAGARRGAEDMIKA